MLSRIESTIASIKTLLLNDKEVKQLLFNDGNNALQKQEPTKQQVEDYITTFPIFDFETELDYEKNGMINIYLIEGSPDDDLNTFDGVIQINVVFNKDKWILLNNKIRPLTLSNRIINLLNNKKITTSNAISFARLQQLILNKKLIGYALLFDITDGNSELNNF